MGNQKEALIGAKKIYEVIESKILWQYRKNAWPGKICLQIQNEIENVVDVAEARIKSQAEAKYKNYIPVPTSGLGTRLKFLFTGKLA